MPVAIVTFIVFPGGGSRTSVSSPSICLHVWPLSRMKTARPRAVLANSSTVARIRVTSSGRGGGGFPNPSALVAGFASPCAAVSKHARRSEDSAIPAHRANSDSASAARSACAGPAKSTNEMQASTEIRLTGRIVSVVLRFDFCRTLRRSTISRLTRVAYVLLHLPQRRLAGQDAFGARVRSPQGEHQEIRMDGLAKAEDLLNALPQVTASQGSYASNGASGTAQVQLRGLGPTRNLVLINGRRLPPGSPDTGSTSNYAADLNQIPVPLIQRIENLTGGASAVYGSDAMSGVVNFIMNDRFEGLQLDLNYSGYNHQQHSDHIADIVRARSATNPSQFQVPGDIDFDGRVRGFSMLMGGNFADNKGNATAYFGYRKEDPVLQSSRDFSACALGPNNKSKTKLATATDFVCAGSGTAANGQFLLNGTDPDTGDVGPGNGPALTVANAAGTTRAFGRAD